MQQLGVIAYSRDARFVGWSGADSTRREPDRKRCCGRHQR